MRNHYIRNRIIRHARSGSLDRAFGLLEDLAGSHDADDPAVQLLRGRLLKERAKRCAGDEAKALFRQSSSLYERAVSAEQQSYPLINAATLALMAGDAEQSRTLAKRTLAALEANPDEAETPYWRHATYAEALLLLGKPDEAKQALIAAAACAPKAWEDHAVTIGQFTLICERMDIPSDWLSAFRPPHCLHFAGKMSVALDDHALRESIDETLERHSIGFGYGALAAGSDIMVAEAILQRGGMVHAILPCPRAIFREQSVTAVDPEWGSRFDRVIEAAESVDVLIDSDGPNATAVALAESVAKGLAAYDARAMKSGMHSLRIEDRGTGKPESDDRIVLTTQRSGNTAPRASNAGRNQIMLAAQSPDQPPAVKHCADVFSALDLAAQHIASGDAVAADICHIPASADQDRLKTRAQALLSVTRAGDFAATKTFAFTALAQRPGLVLDPVGDVKSQNGMFGAYHITAS